MYNIQMMMMNGVTANHSLANGFPLPGLNKSNAQCKNIIKDLLDQSF